LTKTPFFTPFFEKTGGSVVGKSVRKFVPAFRNMLEGGPEENLRLRGPVKKLFMKTHHISTLGRIGKNTQFGPQRHSCFTRMTPANIPDSKIINE
jgi:hypothetical protein